MGKIGGVGVGGGGGGRENSGVASSESTYINFTLHIKGILAVGDLSYFTSSRVFNRINTVLQIRRGKRDNLGIIFYITLLKRML